MAIFGTLGENNLGAISASITDNALDVFVYDTSKDSDGGAWRKRTQNTSWYNETLGTATRGTRREFPAVAVIVIESANKITIYDGDDPDLPMWMIANTDNNMFFENNPFCVSAVNAKIAIGNNPYDLSVVDFLKDQSLEYATGRITIWGNIAKRNDSQLTLYRQDISIVGIIDRYVKDVAMTVLPNAPVDSATGLPVPTIAVATDGGLSIIKDDGTIVDITSDSTVGNQVDGVDFYNNSQLIVTWNTVGTGTRNTYSYNIPAGDTTASASPIGRYVDSSTASGTRLYFSRGEAKASKTVGFKDKKNFVLVPNSFDPSIAIFDEDQTGNEGANGMVAYITSDYNTGWMHGSIKGAFLSDTDDTDKTNGQTDPDRSANQNPLQVFGTVTKTAVATGADLVAYGPFTTNNHLQQPYNSDLNFGTGDFSIMCWIKTSSTSVDIVMSKASPGSIGAPYFEFQMNGGDIYFVGSNTSNNKTYFGNIADGTWKHICYVRSGGIALGYTNGELYETKVEPGNFNHSSNDTLLLGYRQDGYSGTFDGSLALFRISGSIPSAEQIKKIYNDEKVLFQENAKATLYGSSDAVTALAYDDTTNLLHVGTSAGRSDFQGLRRINNTTDPVTTAISAHDSLIIEQ